MSGDTDQSLHRYRLGWRAWSIGIPVSFWMLAHVLTSNSDGWGVLSALLSGRIAILEIGWSALALAVELMVTLVPLLFVAAHLQFPSVRRTNGGLSLERPLRRPQHVSWEELARADEVRWFGFHDFDSNGNPVGGLRLTTADGRSFPISHALTRYDVLVAALAEHCEPIEAHDGRNQ